MTDPANSLVFDLLRACAANAPRPWHPKAFVEAHSDQREDIEFAVNTLCRAGVLRLVYEADKSLAGFLLTPQGAELASDPQAVARLCEAEGLDFSQPDSPQRRAVREMFRTPPTTRVNRVLIGLNIAVFLWGAYLASKVNAAGDFIAPAIRGGGMAVIGPVEKILTDTGLLRREDILQKHWWRLVTCGFVHIGFLHLLMNMYALRVLGTDGEWIWGPRRYLILYFLSLIGGSCAALTTAPGGVAGASGALCGLLAAEGAWMILNRKVLPRRLVRSQMRGLLINGALISLLSLAAGVSGMGHLGGAVVGLVVAVLLHLNRFSSSLTSSLAAAGIIAVPLGCVVGLGRIASNDPNWQAAMRHVETERFRELELLLRETYNQGLEFQRSTLEPLLDKHPARRDEDTVNKALDNIPGLIRRSLAAEEQLTKTPPFSLEGFKEYREAGRDFFRLFAAFLKRVESVLRDKTPWNEDDEKDLDTARARWVKAFRATRAP